MILPQSNTLFSHPFLASFKLTPDLLPFNNDEIVKIDAELSQYEQLYLNPELEKYLITRNELLTSFAISKAEESSLTIKEAEGLYNLVINRSEYSFVGNKLKLGEKLVQKDYEKLEFYNIVKTFRRLNQSPFRIEDLTTDLIKEIHLQTTQGLDIFEKFLHEFTPYKSGQWRDNDKIRVGEYTPAPTKNIESGLKELVSWLKNNQSITSVAVFHTALYALHPFNNGNKRVCRVLEHLLLRNFGINNKNLYSTSYYYHKQKQRYYKYLLYSLERSNLNHFVSFILEAIVLSIISVVETSLEAKRRDFLKRDFIDGQIRFILSPLVKRRELQFKHLFKIAKGKVARQTFVNYLQKATEGQVTTKREVGRTTFYRLNIEAPEEETIKKWLEFANERLSYIPDEIRLV